MAEHNKHDYDDLSRLLDRALASYVPEEPLGLSHRVLGRVQESTRSRQQRRAFRWTFAFASLCLAVLAWLVIAERRTPRGRLAPPIPVPAVALPAERPVAPTLEHQRAQAFPPRTTRRRRPVALVASRSRPSFPKLDQFPAPTPLTNEERALLRLTAQQAAGLLVSSRSSSIVPIDIKPLQMDPF